MMKHKRHQKDRRDKSEKAPRHEDHHYYKAEYCAKTDFKQYTMKDVSENTSEPKKLIIYIVNIIWDVALHCVNCQTFSAYQFAPKMYALTFELSLF